MPLIEKLRQVFDLNRTAQRMAAMRIRPGMLPTSRSASCASDSPATLWLDRATMIEAFGWDPEVKGY